MKMSNTTYNRMKWFVQIFLPALGSLYFGVSQIWGIPATEQVLGTLALVTTFFGVLLGISTNRYNKSDARFDGDVVVVSDDEGNKSFTLEFNDDPYDLDQKDAVTLKVIGGPQFP